VFYITHYKKDILTTALSLLFCSICLLFVYFVALDSKWIPWVRDVIRVFALILPIATLAVFISNLVALPDLSEAVFNNITNISENRVRKSFCNLNNRLAKGNEGTDQARILMQDIALALASGSNIKTLEFLISGYTEDPVSLTYKANYIEKEEPIYNEKQERIGTNKIKKHAEIVLEYKGSYEITII
jgi:hypothetical protein